MRSSARKKQSQPKYEEMCRRYIADGKDFSPDNLERAGITVKFDNQDLDSCLDKVEAYIAAHQKAADPADLAVSRERKDLRNA